MNVQRTPCAYPNCNGYATFRVKVTKSTGVLGTYTDERYCAGDAIRLAKFARRMGWPARIKALL